MPIGDAFLKNSNRPEGQKTGEELVHSDLDGKTAEEMISEEKVEWRLPGATAERHGGGTKPLVELFRACIVLCLVLSR